MLSIQNCLAGSYIPGIIDPGRRFIKEGKLMKVRIGLLSQLCYDAVCIGLQEKTQTTNGVSFLGHVIVCKTTPP